MSRWTGPPRLACRLIAAILPPTIAGRSTLGDLIEEFHQRPRGVRRRLWFWAVTIELAGRYLPGRLRALGGGFVRDLVYAVRLVRRSPALILGALLSLGLAIGVSTAAFTVVNGTWLRATLADDPSLVRAWRRHANGASSAWPLDEFSALRAQATHVRLEGVLPSAETVAPTATPGTTATVTVAFVTGGYLSMLDAGPYAGRLIGPDDDRPGGAPVAVLDHLYWRRSFDGDRGVLGRAVSIGGRDFTIVGIARRDFVDPTRRLPAMWAPLASLERLPARATEPRPWMVGRLGAGMTIADAETALTSLFDMLPRTASPRATAIEVFPVVPAAETAANRQVLTGVFVVITLVLVMACANVSNLQLAGTASRGLEMAVRVSCGASRRRVLRQLATESVLLCSLAGALGLLLASWLTPLLAAGLNLSGPDVDPDARVYLFVVAASGISAIGTGLWPGLHAARHELPSGLKGAAAGRGARRTRSAFIAAQAAASVVLVTLAALQVRALAHLAWQDPGFDVDRVLGVTVAFPRTPDAEARAAAFWPAALDRVRSLPGVETAGLASFTPFGINLGDAGQVFTNGADASYFAAVGQRVLRGRTFSAAEVAAGARVAVASEQVARRFFGDDDPVGAAAGRIDRTYAGVTIVGVVADTIVDRIHPVRTPLVYVPLEADGHTQMAVRTNDPAATAGVVGDALHALAPEVRPTVTALAEPYARQFDRPRRYAALAASVALFALVLSVAGLAGITAFAVRTRRREIGIRMALGARTGDVTGLFVRDGLRPVIVGLMLGFGAALLAGRYMAIQLFGVSARDPLALTLAASLLISAALAAVLAPTRRAARLDPAIVLRDG
jgi:predicted permease